MQFEWSDAKAESNLAKHGVPFAFATRVFLDPQGAAVGIIDGRLFTVVFAQRDGRVRIISARRSNTNEERAYGSFHP